MNMKLLTLLLLFLTSGILAMPQPGSDECRRCQVAFQAMSGAMGGCAAVGSLICVFTFGAGCVVPAVCGVYASATGLASLTCLEVC